MRVVLDSEGRVIAQVVKPEDDKPERSKTSWFGAATSSLQGSLMNYDEGKKFKMHRHILNPRIINRTQECFVVIRGRIRVNIRVDDYGILQSLEASAGDALFVWGGWHDLEILENDTLCYEIKAGSFTSVSEDKEFEKELDW